MRHKRFLICLALLGASASLGVRANAHTGREGAPRQDTAAKPAQTDAGKGADAKAVVDPQKEKSIRRLMEITGSGKVGVQVGQQIIASLRQSQPSVPEEFWEGMSKKFNADALVNLIVPIYAKYYTQEDVDGLIAFYQTPLGQKVISTLPQVSQESMRVGQQWGGQLAEQVMQDMQQRYNADGTPKSDAKPAAKKSAAKAAVSAAFAPCPVPKSRARLSLLWEAESDRRSRFAMSKAASDFSECNGTTGTGGEGKDGDGGARMPCGIG